jgi:hypothetical protein
MTRLKPWQTFRRSRISPNHMTVIAKAVLTLEQATLKMFTGEQAERQGQEGGVEIGGLDTAGQLSSKGHD